MHRGVVADPVSHSREKVSSGLKREPAEWVGFPCGSWRQQWPALKFSVCRKRVVAGPYRVWRLRSRTMTKANLGEGPGVNELHVLGKVGPLAPLQLLTAS